VEFAWEGDDADPVVFVIATENDEALVFGLLAGISGHAAIQDIVIADAKHKVERGGRGHFSGMVSFPSPTITIRFSKNGS
jgi:hypothetical protein